MNKTSIEWTATPMPDGTMRPGFSANPLKYRRKSDGKVVWACVKHSTGCLNCYSETIALRWQKGKLFNAKNMEELEPFLDQKELRKILTAKTVQGIPVSGSKCFVGDMTDLFGEWVTDEHLDRLFGAFASRPDVTFQILTKRAERLHKYLSNPRLFRVMGVDFEFPLPNVWVGVSCENQAMADKRLPFVLATPAAVRFASFEPLLGPIEVFTPGCPYPKQNPVGPRVSSGCLDWAIVGGESGHGARPMHPDWAVGLRDQCLAAGVPFFFKWTLGLRESRNWPVAKVGKSVAGRRIDGIEWSQFPKVR